MTTTCNTDDLNNTMTNIQQTPDTTFSRQIPIYGITPQNFPTLIENPPAYAPYLSGLVVPVTISDPITSFDISYDQNTLLVGTTLGKVYHYKIDHLLRHITIPPITISSVSSQVPIRFDCLKPESVWDVCKLNYQKLKQETETTVKSNANGDDISKRKNIDKNIIQNETIVALDTVYKIPFWTYITLPYAGIFPCVRIAEQTEECVVSLHIIRKPRVCLKDEGDILKLLRIDPKIFESKILALDSKDTNSTTTTTASLHPYITIPSYSNIPSPAKSDYSLLRVFNSTSHIKPNTFLAAVGDQCIKLGRLFHDNPTQLQSMRYTRAHNQSICHNTIVSNIDKHSVCLFVAEDCANTVMLDALYAKMFVLHNLHSSVVATFVDYRDSTLTWAEPIPCTLPQTLPQHITGNILLNIPIRNAIVIKSHKVLANNLVKILKAIQKHKDNEKKAVHKLRSKGKHQGEMSVGQSQSQILSRSNGIASSGGSGGGAVGGGSGGSNGNIIEATYVPGSSPTSLPTPTIFSSTPSPSFTGYDYPNIAMDNVNIHVSTSQLESALGSLVSLYHVGGQCVSHVVALRSSKMISRAVISGTNLISVVEGNIIHVHRTIPIHALYLLSLLPYESVVDQTIFDPTIITESLLSSLTLDYTISKETEIQYLYSLFQSQYRSLEHLLQAGQDFHTQIAHAFEDIERCTLLYGVDSREMNDASNQLQNVILETKNHVEVLCRLRQDIYFLQRVQALCKSQRKYKFTAHDEGVILSIIAEQDGDFIITLANDYKIKIWVYGECICKIVNIPGSFNLLFPPLMKRVGQQIFYVATDGIFSVTIPIKIAETNHEGRPYYQDEEVVMEEMREIFSQQQQKQKQQQIQESCPIQSIATTRHEYLQKMFYVKLLLQQILYNQTPAQTVETMLNRYGKNQGKSKNKNKNQNKDKDKDKDFMPDPSLFIPFFLQDRQKKKRRNTTKNRKHL